MKIYSILKLLPVLILINTTLYSGAKVSIILKNGNQINGELLVATDSTFVISQTENLNQEKLTNSELQIIRLRKDEVSSFIVCGKSHFINGIVLGFAAGICIGGLMAYEPRGVTEWGSNYDSYGSGFKTIMLFAVGGAGLGAFLGEQSSTSNRVLSKAELKNHNYLAKMAKYGSKEPEWLRNIY
jgi:hypothetical protein